MSPIKKVVVIHGSIKRRSTYEWLNALTEHLRRRGFDAEWVEWSGIPLKAYVKSASRKLLAACEKQDPQEQVIIAKSVGADVANLVLERMLLRLVIGVAPAFVASSEIRTPEIWAWIRLSEDRFVRFWEKLGVVRTIEPPRDVRLYEIEHRDNSNHHVINENIGVTVKGLGSILMYDLYVHIIETIERKATAE